MGYRSFLVHFESQKRIKPLELGSLKAENFLKKLSGAIWRTKNDSRSFQGQFESLETTQKAFRGSLKAKKRLGELAGASNKPWACWKRQKMLQTKPENSSEPLKIQKHIKSSDSHSKNDKNLQIWFLGISKFSHPTQCWGIKNNFYYAHIYVACFHFITKRDFLITFSKKKIFFSFFLLLKNSEGLE